MQTGCWECRAANQSVIPGTGVRQMGRSPLAGAQLNTQWRRKAHRAEWKWNQFEDSEAAAGVCAFSSSPSINHRYPIKILHLVPVQNDTLTLSLSPETTTWIRRCRTLKERLTHANGYKVPELYKVTPASAEGNRGTRAAGSVQLPSKSGNPNWH